MAKKKKRTALPRVTVLALSRRELVSFVQAVETLRLLVEDLRVITTAAKPKTRRKPTAPPDLADAIIPDVPRTVEEMEAYVEANRE